MADGDTRLPIDTVRAPIRRGTIMRALRPVALAITSLALLTGCFAAPAGSPSSGSSPETTAAATIPTIPIPEMMEFAAAYMTEEVGSPVTLECGGNPDGVMPYVDGSTIECVGTTEDNPLPQRIAITLKLDAPDDDDWGFSTSGAADRDPAPGTPTIDGSVIEELANESFDREGIQAAALCEDVPVPIEVGHEVFCTAVLGSGGFAPVVVEVTSFDGDTFMVRTRIIE
jgi:hypothetical protein